MAETKDKVITAESLNVLHEYNKEIYETKEDAENYKNSLNENLEKNFFGISSIVPIDNGGTNSSNGATGLANLLASGAMVLSSHQYGENLPEAGTAGRIFFKKLLDV